MFECRADKLETIYQYEHTHVNSEAHITGRRTYFQRPPDGAWRPSDDDAEADHATERTAARSVA